LIRQKRIDVESLINREVALEEVTAAYDELGNKEGPNPLAVVIAYPDSVPGHPEVKPLIKMAPPPAQNGVISLGLIGAGSFAKSTHIPNLENLKQGIRIVGVCTGTGATASTLGRQLNAPIISNDYREIVNSPGIDAVLVSTRHHNHAEIAEAALKADKHVYLEKPLALTLNQLDSLDRTVRGMSSCPVFMVGFNRRYSPFARQLAELLSRRTTPLVITYRVNAGTLPANHWSVTEEGGGRLRGEACHMVDLFRFLVNKPLEEYDIQALRSQPNLRPDENFVAHFRYADGSLCTLVYTAIGNRELAKEWVEVHWDGRSGVLDDFKELSLYGCSGNLSLSRQDKGHPAALESFINAISSGISFPTPWEQLYETTQLTIALDREVWGRLPA
ncbi:MAG: hypothetical protein DME19_07720, partial [Verrucomicrobia bacterium]